MKAVKLALALLLVCYCAPAVRAQSLYEVRSVVDGDTLYTSRDRTRARLIGVVAPEWSNSCRGIGGLEATRALTDLLAGRFVRVGFEPLQRFDKYKRPLLYLWRSDGLFVNDYLIRQGFARYAPGGTKSRYARQFAEAQSEAIRERRGIWREEK